MFTCCPNCETVFKVSAKHLQQAAGKVRCGRCDFSFNALSNIQESASEAAANLKALAEKGEDTATPPDDLPEEEVGDPEQRIPWQLVSETESSSLDTGGAAPNDDPIAFAMPWVTTRMYVHRPGLTRLPFDCVVEDAGYEEF